MTSVADAVGRALARSASDVVFGVVGSGNLVATNALRRGGARFLAARHESGAIGHGRRLGAGERAASASARVHQGPGLTNAVTGARRGGEERARRCS